MAQKTVQQQANTLPDDVKAKLRDMALAGKSITYMAANMKYPYAVVQAYLWQSGSLPWQGAKSIISRRLRSLSTATRREDRDDLVADIKEQVNYLYYAAREQADQLEKVKKTVR